MWSLSGDARASPSVGIDNILSSIAIHKICRDIRTVVNSSQTPLVDIFRTSKRE